MRYYSVEQAAELSGFHPNTIRRWADDGTIP
ncbi:MAG: DNA-binding protein, partial [Synergistales bacterium]|nr:DNA-binding protein [Synergistales bacterium]